MFRLVSFFAIILFAAASSSCNESVNAGNKNSSAKAVNLKIDESIKLSKDVSLELADVTDLRCERNICDRCFPNVAIVSLILKNKDHTKEFSVDFPGCFEEAEEQSFEKEIEMDGSRFVMRILEVTPYDNSLDKTIRLSIAKI